MTKAFRTYKSQFPQLMFREIMPNEWIVWIDGKKACKQLKTQLRERIKGKALEHKWPTGKTVGQQIQAPKEHKWPTGRKVGQQIRAPKFTQQQVAIMDFQTIKHAWIRSSSNGRRFITKLGAEQLPTGTYIYKRKYWKKSKCPCCMHTD
jgi:hypothetical protein